MDDMPVRILHHWDQKADAVESVAKELAYGYSLKDCDAEDTVAFRAWLAGDADEMSTAMPKSSLKKNLIRPSTCPPVRV